MVLAAIFLLAFFLRFFHLGNLPLYFHQDEVLNGYVGRFILETGKDLYGNSLPLLYFDRFGDFPNVIPMYLSGLGTLIFGASEFAVRLPIALIGSLTVVIFYFLGKLVLNNKTAALLLAFLLAVNPWHIVLSRATAEGVTALAVFSLGLYLVIKAVVYDSRKLLLFSSALFLLTYFLYPGYRIFTPIALLPLPFFNKKFLPVVIFFLCLTLLISTTVWGQGRFSQTSLFYNTAIREKIETANAAFSFDDGSNRVFEARVFHNKFTGFFKEGVEQYLSYFSPSFLFIKGGLPDRYIVPNQGLFYLTMIVFLTGLFLPVKKKRPFYYYFFYLLLVAPIPAALTVDDVPNTHRAAGLILPFCFLAAMGLENLLNFIKNRQLKIGLVIAAVLLIGLETVYFWHQYVNHTASYKSIYRNGGSQELMVVLKEKQAEADQVVMPSLDTLPLYYLFYQANFDRSLAGLFGDNLKIDKIDNVFFVGNWCPEREFDLNSLPGRTILISRSDCDTPAGFTQTREIRRHDSTVAFKVLQTGF